MELGTYLEYDGRPAVRLERTYPNPVDRVWAAISDPADLSRWFPSTVGIEPKTGGLVTYSGDPFMDDTTGVVRAIDPPHHLAFSWGTEELIFELEPTADGSSKLVLIDVLDDKSSAARNGAGWCVCLAELAKLLSGDTPDGPHSDSAESWQEYYDAHIAAGIPAGAQVPGQ